MYKYEPCFPPNSKIFRQDMYTWWKRERYMAVHPNHYSFSGRMSEFYPESYPIRLWNEWPFNIGMNNMDPAVFPCYERGFNFYKSSKKNDKTGMEKINKVSEPDFQPQQGQVEPRKNVKSAHSVFLKHHGQFNQRYIPPPIPPSCYIQPDPFIYSPRHIPPPIIHPSCFKQQGRFSSRQMPPRFQPSDAMKRDQQGRRHRAPQVQVSHHNTCKKPNINSNVSRNQVCRFCLQNGEGEEFYSDHQLKDQDGKVTCPILRRYVCDICKATGDFAHTRAYCPLYRGKNKKPLAVILKQTYHDSSGRIRK